MTEQEEIKRLQGRMAWLETELQKVKSDLNRLVWRTREEPAKKAPRSDSPPEASPAPPPATPVSSPSESLLSKIARTDMELFLGGNLLGKLGMLALILTTAWFIKLAFDNHWINESGRIYTGLFFGFLVWGSALYLARKGFRRLAPAVLGTGIAMLYVSVFSAFYFYRLLGRTETFAALFILSAVASYFALRARSQALYIFSLLGAFLAPMLLSSGENSYRFLFSYVLVVNLGFLYVSRAFPWRISPFLLLTADFLIYGFWAGSNLSRESTGFIFPFAYLTLVFLLFLYRELFLLPRRHGRAEISGLLLVFLVSGAYLISGFIQVAEFYENLREHFLLFAGGISLGAYYFYNSRERTFLKEDCRYLIPYFQACLLIVWFSASVPALVLFMDGFWGVAIFISLGAGFSLTAVMGRIPRLLIPAIPLWFVALLGLYSFVLRDLNYRLFLNNRFFLYVLATLLLSLTYLYRKHKPLHPGLRFFAFAAMFSIILGCLMEVHDFVDNAHWRNLGYSYVPALFAALFLAFGFIRKSHTARYSGIVLALLVVLKLYVYDIWTMSRVVRIVAGLSLGVGLISLSFLYQKFRGKIMDSKNDSLKLVFFLLLSGTLFGSTSELSAENFRSAGFHFYKDLGGLTPAQLPDDSGGAYGVLELDEEILANAGSNDLRIALGDQALPHFTRNIKGSAKGAGHNTPQVIFSKFYDSHAEYLLKLPEPPAGAEYRELEVRHAGAFEVSVDLMLGISADRQSHYGARSLYSYGGEKSNILKFKGGDNNYIRLRIDSTKKFTFRRTLFLPRSTNLEFKIPLKLEDLSLTRDSDRQATVFYFKNEKSRKINRLHFTFKEKRFNRNLEIHRMSARSREYHEFARTRIAAGRKGQKSDQIVELHGGLTEALKIVILNGDNKPLTLESLTAYGPREEVVFALPARGNAEAGKLRLYYGNKYAFAPRYEIRSVYDSKLAHRKVTAGGHLVNEDFGYSAVEPPLSMWIIRGLFLAGLLGMGWPAYRILGSFAKEGEERGAEG